jgi:hypothetical protein
MHVKEQTGIRPLVEDLLELSNSILAATIGGSWNVVDELERRRVELFEKVLEAGEISGSDRIFLIGAMEHIRATDAMAREFPRRDRSSGAQERESAASYHEDDLEFLAFEAAGPERPKARPLY